MDSIFLITVYLIDKTGQISTTADSRVCQWVYQQQALLLAHKESLGEPLIFVPTLP